MEASRRKTRPRSYGDRALTLAGIKRYNTLPMNLSFLAIVIQLIFLEGILSIDNAAVLGAMVSVLPDDETVPYPRPLRFLQPFTDHVLGMQQSAALKVGLLGAYIGRGLMLFLATYIIQNPWLRLLGAAYLIKLAFSHLPGYAEPTIGGEIHAANQQGAELATAAFWAVVLQVELADLAFSLDNVVAAVALSSHFWVVMLGVALGILTMRFAAGIFTVLIKREPILAPAAYVLVLNIAIELVIEDFHIYDFNEWAKFAVSLGTLLLALVYAHSPFLRRISQPLFHLAGRGMAAANRAVDALLRPVGLLVRAIFRALAPALGWLVALVAPKRSNAETEGDLAPPEPATVDSD